MAVYTTGAMEEVKFFWYYFTSGLECLMTGRPLKYIKYYLSWVIKFSRLNTANTQFVMFLIANNEKVNYQW